jgi:hypothetical protein
MATLGKWVACVALSAAAAAVQADAMSGVSINGQMLTVTQLMLLQQQLGTQIPTGNYLVDPMNGCWANMSTGQSGCPGTVDTFGRYGSGERSSNGDWSYYSNAAGGAVGGTGDGCVYAFDWSNC